jgi:hypothetical protein
MGIIERIKKKYSAHKYGIMGTTIFHLLLIIALLYIGISAEIQNPEFEIEMKDFTPQELQQKLEETERKHEILRQTTQEEVQRLLRSIAVNENVNRTKETDSKVHDYIDEIQKELDAQRGGKVGQKKDEKYMLDSLQHERERRAQMLDSLRSTIYAGESSASYDLKDRYARFLPIPVYRCEFGGKVVVNIIVDRKGAVRKAVVDPSRSTTDDCIIETAVDAALRSQFNESSSAPASQQGTITFVFVKQ